MWFWIWFALGVATLGAASLVLRDLWRRLSRTGAALGDVGALVGRFDAQVREAQERAATHHVPRPVTVLDDPEIARRRVAERAEARAERRSARRGRQRERWAQWSRFNE